MTPAQCRMARAALQLGVRDLAALARVSPNTISRLERGENLYDSTLEVIGHALEAVGIEFIADNGGGAGVRFKELRSAD
nr:helix-turn-helix transcriptional regulator [Labrys miyagiensis]